MDGPFFPPFSGPMFGREKSRMASDPLESERRSLGRKLARPQAYPRPRHCSPTPMARPPLLHLRPGSLRRAQQQSSARSHKLSRPGSTRRRSQSCSRCASRASIRRRSLPSSKSSAARRRRSAPLRTDHRGMGVGKLQCSRDAWRQARRDHRRFGWSTRERTARPAALSRGLGVARLCSCPEQRDPKVLVMPPGCKSHAPRIVHGGSEPKHVECMDYCSERSWMAETSSGLH